MITHKKYMKNLSFGVSLAPYRLDFYNYLSEHFNCTIYFQLKGFKGQLFSTENLEKKCTYKPLYLETIKIRERHIVKHLSDLVKNNRPNVILVPEFSLLTIQVILYKFITRKKFKIISLCDDSYDILMGNGFTYLHHLARKIVVPFLDDLILVDTKAVEWYQEHYHKGIWMPIIRNEKKLLPYYETLKEKALQLKSRYQNKIILLFVGRLIDVKNIPLLLQAYKQLGNTYKLIIIGDGEYMSKLKSIALKENLDIDFLGKKENDELFVWYQAADIFILPSYREAFGAVTNEALLAGCKCVISKHAGSSCLIEEGINGYTFDPYSTDELVDCIKKATTLLSPNRKSQMTVTFTECMNNMINKLNQP